MRIGNNTAIIVLTRANYTLNSTTLTIPTGGKTWLIVESVGPTLQYINGGEGEGSLLLLTCSETGTNLNIEKGAGFIWWDNYYTDMGPVSGITLSLTSRQSILLQKTADGTWVMLTMTSGAMGNTGIQGAQGMAGAGGFQGDAGSAGGDGRTGSVGAQGNQGVDGATGDIGGIGLQGVQGATGVTGAEGVAGDAGAIGSQGSAGAQGAQGVAGLVASPGDPGMNC
jgi:hypothetical protein